jgi:hypothetical protein
VPQAKIKLDVLIIGGEMEAYAVTCFNISTVKMSAKVYEQRCECTAPFSAAIYPIIPPLFYGD